MALAFTTASGGGEVLSIYNGVSRGGGVCWGGAPADFHIWRNHDSHLLDAISPFHPISLAIPELFISV